MRERRNRIGFGDDFTGRLQDGSQDTPPNHTVRVYHDASNYYYNVDKSEKESFEDWVEETFNKYGGKAVYNIWWV